MLFPRSQKPSRNFRLSFFSMMFAKHWMFSSGSSIARRIFFGLTIHWVAFPETLLLIFARFSMAQIFSQIPLSEASNWFSLLVPSQRWSGLMQPLLSHVWQTTHLELGLYEVGKRRYLSYGGMTPLVSVWPKVRTHSMTAHHTASNIRQPLHNLRSTETLSSHQCPPVS